MTITFRDARTTIERALIDELRLAHARRLPAVSLLEDLRRLAIAGAAVVDGALRFVTEVGFCYAWQPWDTRPGDETEVLLPHQLAAGAPGRWVRTKSTAPDGYLRRCELYNEDEDQDTINARLLGEKPALLVSFESARHKAVSNRAGALYWYVCSFSLLAISTSMRGEQAPRHGSRRPAEAAEDPGTAAILGDAKAVLAGSTIGLEDVERVELGDEKPVIVALAKRTVVEQLDVTVWATVSGDDLVVPLSIQSQRQMPPESAGGGSTDSTELTDVGGVDIVLLP